MQIEHFFYWFWDPAWWMGASQGAVGALIGFGGLYAAYRFSQAGDKTKRIEERTLSGVASLMQICISLNQKQPYEVTDEELHTLQTELMLFHVHQLQGRPQTAEWAVRQSGMLRLRKWSPFGNAIARENAGKIVDDLSDWVKSNYHEGMLHPDNVLDDWESISIRFREALNNSGVAMTSPDEDHS